MKYSKNVVTTLFGLSHDLNHIVIFKNIFNMGVVYVSGTGAATW